MEQIDTSLQKLSLASDVDSSEIEVLFEDENIAIVWKPSHMATSRNGISNTANKKSSFLSDFLPNLLQTADGNELEIVTNIERGIAGLVVVAKTPEVFASLRHMDSDKRITSRYLGICHGRVGKGKPGSQVCFELPIDNWAAITSCKVVDLARSDSNPEGFLSLVELRSIVSHLYVTQQFRIHMHAYGNPLVGTMHWTHPLLGESAEHAHHMYMALVGIEFKHPIDDDIIHLNVSLPDSFSTLLAREQAEFRAKHPESHESPFSLQLSPAERELVSQNLAESIQLSKSDHECNFCGLPYLSHPLSPVPTLLCSHFVAQILVQVRERLAKTAESKKRVLLLDLQAGSGIASAHILLQLSPEERERVFVYGICSSHDVYEIAKQNVALSELETRFQLRAGVWTRAGCQGPLLHSIQDWVHTNCSDDDGVDFIFASSLPWLSQQEWADMNQPALELVDKRNYVSGGTGLECFTHLLTVCKDFLRLAVDLHHQKQSDKGTSTGTGLFLKPENSLVGYDDCVSPPPGAENLSNIELEDVLDVPENANGALKRQSSLMQRKYSLSRVLKAYGGGYSSEGWGSLGRKTRSRSSSQLSRQRSSIDSVPENDIQTSLSQAELPPLSSEHSQAKVDPPVTVFQQYSDVLARRRPVWVASQTVLLFAAPTVRSEPIVGDIFASWNVEKVSAQDFTSVFAASFKKRLFE